MKGVPFVKFATQEDPERGKAPEGGTRMTVDAEQSGVQESNKRALRAAPEFEIEFRRLRRLAL